MAKNPRALREKAKALLLEADKIDQTAAIEIGKYVLRAGYGIDAIKTLLKLESVKKQMEQLSEVNE